MTTGIVVALPEETVTLVPKALAKGQSIVFSSHIKVVCSGMGPENAAAATENLIAKGASRLISWGCAAALKPTLKSGDLIVANQVNCLGETDLIKDNQWFERTRELLAEICNPAGTAALYCGTLSESKALIGKTEKQNLYAHSGSLALDMESGAIARVAARHNLPFLAIRAIADTADMEMPKAVVYATDTDGHVSLAALLGYLLKHPSQLPELIKLGHSFSKAKRTLKKVAVQLEAIVQ